MIFDNINIYLNSDDVSVKKINKYKNNIVFLNTLNRFINIFLGSFEFDGLESGMNERVIKLSMLFYGSCVFYQKEGNYLTLPGLSGGNYNIYGDSGNFYVYGFNGYTEKVDLFVPGGLDQEILNHGTTEKIKNQKGVLIRHNDLQYPLIRIVEYFASAVADTYRTLDVCRMNMKQPFVITCEESLVNSVRQFFKKRNSNDEYIISSGIFPADKISLLPFETNSVNLTDSTSLIDWYENKFKEILGIDNNSNIDKKGENLIESEVSINSEYTDLNLYSCLKRIQEDLDLFNKVYNTNITVKKSNSQDDTNIFYEEEKEDVEDEDISGNIE